jgi:hypothetical protein
MLLADRKTGLCIFGVVVKTEKTNKQIHIKKAFGDLMTNMCQKKDFEC